MKFAKTKVSIFLLKFLMALATILKLVAVEVWAFITSEGQKVSSWHIDPWKVSGLASFGLTVYFAFEALHMAQTNMNAGAVGIVASLSGTFVTVGTLLFNQAAKNDADIRSRFTQGE